MIGRFIGSLVTLRLFKPGKVLAVHAVVASLLVLASTFTTGWTAVITIIAVGLLNSVMFPTIFTLAIDGLGRHTEQGSGILCAAIVGGAFIPALQGVFADSAGSAHQLPPARGLLHLHRVVRPQGPRDRREAGPGDRRQLITSISAAVPKE